MVVNVPETILDRIARYVGEGPLIMRVRQRVSEIRQRIRQRIGG